MDTFSLIYHFSPFSLGDGRVVRWFWVTFQCQGVLLIWIRVGQGSTALAVGAGGGCLDIFSLIYHFSFPSPSLWETARYRLKYCLKGPLSPKQPINQSAWVSQIMCIMIVLHPFFRFCFSAVDYPPHHDSAWHSQAICIIIILHPLFRFLQL